MSNMCVTTLDKKPRPSLPREFFARLYESEPQRPVDEDEDEEVDVTSDSGDGKDERSAPPTAPTQLLQTLEPRSVGPEETIGLVPPPLLPADSTVAPPHWRLLQLAHLHGISAYTASVQHLQGQAAYLARRKKKEGRPRRQRTIFSSEQTLRLEDEYRRNAYITRSRRSELADCLNLTETQIKIWFQNHRAKHKRLEKTEQDQYARDLAVAESLMRGVQPLGVLCRFCRMSFYLCICLRTPAAMGSRALLPPPASSTTTSPVPISTSSVTTRNPECDGSPSATVMPL